MDRPSARGVEGAWETLPYSTSLDGHEQDIGFGFFLEGSQTIRSVDKASLSVDLQIYDTGSS